MYENYNNLLANYKVYQKKFDKLVSKFATSYLINYFEKTKKIMPIEIAHFLAKRTMVKLIENKWFDEELNI